jgi:hypothetical protein
MPNNHEVNLRRYETLMILSNAIQASVKAIKATAGNEISTGLGGEELTNAELANTMAAKISSYALNPVGGK